MAVKVLLDVEEAQRAAPEAAWTLSNPILCNLQKVGGYANQDALLGLDSGAVLGYI